MSELRKAVKQMLTASHHHNDCAVHYKDGSYTCNCGYAQASNRLRQALESDKQESGHWVSADNPPTQARLYW